MGAAHRRVKVHHHLGGLLLAVCPRHELYDHLGGLLSSLGIEILFLGGDYFLRAIFFF